MDSASIPKRSSLAEGEPNCPPPMASQMTPRPHRPPPTRIVLLFIGIIFGILFGIIFVNEINEMNENVLKCKLELYFGNVVIVMVYLMNHYVHVDFITSRKGLREPSVFEYAFNVICNRIDFVYGENNNENFCDYEYYYGELFNGYYAIPYPTPTPTPTPTPQIIFTFNDSVEPIGTLITFYY